MIKLKYMNKIIIFSIIFLMLIPNTTIFAESPTYVKVGLISKFANSKNVKLNNNNIVFGEEVNGTFAEKGILSSENGFDLLPTYDYFVKSNLKFNSLSDVLNSYRNISQKSVVAYLGENNWEIYYGGFNKNEALNLQNQTGGEVVNFPEGKALIRSNNVTILSNSQTSNAQIKGIETLLDLGDKKYRGLFELSVTPKGLTLINVVSMEEYLYSVVPSEMPSSWHIEALKAQAVAARTYSITMFSVHKDNGFNLCDTDHCQVYLGQTQEKVSTTQAVNETLGKVAYYNSKPINATFFSSSGGVTEQGDKVWTESVPYLQSVKDSYENEYKKWTRTFSFKELEDLLSKSNINIGRVKSVTAKSSSISGRVTDFTISASNGSKTFSKGEIRSFFSKSSSGALDSNHFTLGNSSETTSSTTNFYVMSDSNYIDVPINNLKIASSNGEASVPNDVSIASKDAVQKHSLTEKVSKSSSKDSIVISGKGWGHGVGMSQFGAKGMAEAGFNYEQILKHYYTGIEVY